MAELGKFRRKTLRVAVELNNKLVPFFSPRMATKGMIKIYSAMGMKFRGVPNYISSRVNFDGTDYSLIEIHEGVTISSYVRVLSHDWSLYTVSKSVGHFSKKPIGRISPVSIGPYSFVGTGTVIMPGTVIGRGCLIGAGTVVRGNIPDYSIVVGSPGNIIGDTREFIAKNFARMGLSVSGLNI